MSLQRPSQWPVLFDVALQILFHAEKSVGFAPEWSFGGGTALMLQIDHRESHDIDLFLDDPQLLPFLNPETQGVDLERLPDSYSTESHVLKLAYKDIGEIDFICGAHIVESPTQIRDVNGHGVAMETPAEIIAKKVYYRGSMLQPRDMFDLAAVTNQFGSDYVVDALRQCGKERCLKALRVVDRVDPEFVRKIAGQLMVRENMRELVDRAQDLSRQILTLATRG